ncbi:MAG: zinc dependent phospholipase C family protein [Clostridiales bacterium]|nr:zinc dependent phospholipase C family protein [Clostridiales bacterium]
MPGFITHYICGEAALKRLPAEIATIITDNREIYNVGCQGPDMFFYYIPGLLKKNMKNLGIDMHVSNVQTFLMGMADAAADADSYTKPLLIAYLFGYLCHYALDYSAHPYVYYKAGFRLDGDRSPKLRYSVYHRRFETAVDVLMLKMFSGQKPNDKKLWQLIKAEKDHAQVVAAMVSAAINNAYDRSVSPKEVFNAIKHMVWVTRVLQSRRGRRKRFMNLAENLTVKEHLVSSLIHDQEIVDGIDYLNTQKLKWSMPWDEEAESTHSFGELYNIAIVESEKLMVSMWDYLNGKMSREDLLAVVGNRSLKSGLEIEKDKDFVVHGSVFA